MSSRTLIAVVVVILVILGAYWYFSAQSAVTQPNSQSASQTLGTSASDTSDASLNQDSAAIDAQMNSLNADATAANQTDQPVTQSY